MGPNYSVSFSVKRDENSDDSEQILFESSKGTFKAVQAGTGKLGFSREGMTIHLIMNYLRENG